MAKAKQPVNGSVKRRAGLKAIVGYVGDAEHRAIRAAAGWSGETVGDFVARVATEAAEKICKKSANLG